MVNVPASPFPDGTLTRAQRIARIAQGAHAQAAVDQAPPVTREQITALRAILAPATLAAAA